MARSKTTKRALVASVCATLMCIAMLIGTTFAWFTDTASTSVNKIQSGTLDVELYSGDNASGGEGTNWTKIESGSAALKFLQSNGTTASQTDFYWEPGGTYSLPALKIVNNGNLALKYKVVITGIEGNAKLNEVIDWTITLDNATYAVDAEHKLAAKTESATDSDILTIEGHMQETAGNDYQNLSIDGIAITVVATQDTVEFDSSSNTYDQSATYLNTDAEGNILIGSAGDLRYFAAMVNADSDAYAGKTIKLTSNIDLGGAAWTPINMTGTSIDYGNKRVTFDGQNYTISNFKVTAAEGEHNTGFFGNVSYLDIKNLKISGATVSGINRVGAIVGRGMCTTLTECTVTNSTLTATVWWDPAEKSGAGWWNDGDKVGAIAGWLDEGAHNVTGCTVDGCTITGYRDIAGLVGYVGNGSSSTATVSGNTIKNTTVTQVLTNGYEESTPTTVEAVVGRYYTGLDLTGNTATENVTVNKGTAATGGQ